MPTVIPPYALIARSWHGEAWHLIRSDHRPVCGQIGIVEEEAPFADHPGGVCRRCWRIAEGWTWDRTLDVAR